MSCVPDESAPSHHRSCTKVHVLLISAQLRGDHHKQSQNRAERESKQWCFSQHWCLGPMWGPVSSLLSSAAETPAHPGASQSFLPHFPSVQGAEQCSLPYWVVAGKYPSLAWAYGGVACLNIAIITTILP